MLDFNGRAGFQSFWPLFLLLVDLSILAGLPRRVTTIKLFFMMVWLTFMYISESSWIELYSIPGTPTWENRMDMKEHFCGCSGVPCKQEWGKGIFDLAMILVVVVMNSVATESFAGQVTTEQAAMAKTIAIMEEVSHHLAGYNVEKVRQVLCNNSASLPPKILEAMQGIEENLRQYRPYLPRSCFHYDGTPDTPQQRGSAFENTTPLNLKSPKESTIVKEDVTSVSTLPMLQETGSVVSVVGCEESHISRQSSQSSLHIAVRRTSEATATPATPGLIPSPSMTSPVRAFNLPLKRMTLLHVDIANELLHTSHPGQDSEDYRGDAYNDYFGRVIAAVLSAVERRKGICDVFVGSAVSASFNASRVCIIHGTSGVKAAVDIAVEVKSIHASLKLDNTDHPCSIAVCSGRALCGDMGSADMRRFNIVGSLPRLGAAMCGFARSLSREVVCDNDTQQDADCLFSIRLLPHLLRLVRRRVVHGVVAYATLGQGRCVNGAHLVFEVLPAVAVAPAAQSAEAEWLYEVGDNALRWSAYNAGVRLYLNGGSEEAACKVAGPKGPEVASVIRDLGAKDPFLVG